MRLVDAIQYLGEATKEGYVDESVWEDLQDKPYTELIRIVDELSAKGDAYANDYDTQRTNS